MKFQVQFLMNHTGLKIDTESFFEFETGMICALRNKQAGRHSTPSTEQLTPQLGSRVLPGPPVLGSGVRWKHVWGIQGTVLLPFLAKLAAPGSSQNSEGAL